MITSGSQHPLSGRVACVCSLLAQVFSVVLLSFSAAATAATAAAVDPFTAATADEQKPVDECAESILSGGANSAYCDAVINALSDSLLNTNQSWELAAALSNRALSRSRTGELEGAIDDLSAAINIMPRWAELYVNRGNLYLKTAAHDAALADYEQALLLSGGRLDAVLFNRAFLQRALGQPKRAEDELLLWQATPVPVVPDATVETVEPLSGG